uniref:Uncharacterized protein n=1 Tax=Capra hircus TaxID=9925 RepID=A0A8C2NFN4_CAPHI
MPKSLTVWITVNWKILKEKGIPDHLTYEVHQNQILRELYLKELRTQKLYTQYHVNPLRKGEGRYVLKCIHILIKYFIVTNLKGSL